MFLTEGSLIPVNVACFPQKKDNLDKIFYLHGL